MRALILVGLCFLSGCAHWQERRNSHGGYAVQLPGGASRATRNFKSVLLGPVLFRQMGSDEGHRLFVVQYYDLSEEALEKHGTAGILRVFSSGPFLGCGGGGLGSKTRNLGDHPGCEVALRGTMKSPWGGRVTGMARANVYLVGRRVYQLVVVTGEHMAYSKDIDRFFDSFRLLSDPAKPAQ